MKQKTTSYSKLYSGFAPILILILVIALGAVGYFSYKSYISQKGQNNDVLIPPRDPTANWKTYTNTQYSFSFKYPSDLEVVLGYSDNPGNIGVVIKDGGLSTSVKKDEFDINTLENIPIQNNTLSFKKAKFERAYNGFAAFLELDSGTTLLIDKMISAGINDADINAEFDQIISTFKFTNTSELTGIPKPIADLFAKINTQFSLNLIPIEEQSFYSPLGQVDKKSWKINLLGAPIDKSLTTFLLLQLKSNDSKSGGIGGGGVDAFENESIECYHIYMSKMPTGEAIQDELSCALK